MTLEGKHKCLSNERSVIMGNYKTIIKETLKKTTYSVSEDCVELIKESYNNSDNDISKVITKSILDNIRIAKEKKCVLCQSPGYGTIYIKHGRDMFVENIEELLKESIVELTKEGFLRPSLVDPLTRKNNGDNTGYRAINIEYELDKDIDYIEMIISFKGCGVEVFNRSKVFTIAEMGTNYEGIEKFVLETVSEGGGRPCLPVAIGIGIGGQVDVAARLSRKAVSTRSWKERNKQPDIRDLEVRLLEKINMLHIGSGGLGGNTTALAVNIETAATHTAICPVSVNFHCWTARRAGVRIYSNGCTEDVKF